MKYLPQALGQNLVAHNYHGFCLWFKHRSRRTRGPQDSSCLLSSTIPMSPNIEREHGPPSFGSAESMPLTHRKASPYINPKFALRFSAAPCSYPTKVHGDDDGTSPTAMGRNTTGGLRILPCQEKDDMLFLDHVTQISADSCASEGRFTGACQLASRQNPCVEQPADQDTAQCSETGSCAQGWGRPLESLLRNRQVINIYLPACR